MTTFRKSRHKYKSLMKKYKSGTKNKNRHGGKNKKHRMTHKIKTSRQQINNYRNGRNKGQGLVSRKKSGRARFTKKRKSNILQKGGKSKKDKGKTKSKKDEAKGGPSTDNSSEKKSEGEKSEEEDSEEEKPPGFMKRRKMGYCIDTKNSVDGKENTCPNKHTGTITSTASSVWAGMKSAGSNLLKMMNPYAAVASKAMEKTMELQQSQIDAKNSMTDLNKAKAAEARSSLSSGAMGMAKKMAMKTPQGRALAMAQKATGATGIPGASDVTGMTGMTGKTGKTDKS